MADKNGKSQMVPISVVVALCAALGVIVYNQAPLKGIRPSVPEMREPSQKISSRLWQDPFQAVLNQKEAISMEIQVLKSEIENHLKRKENVTVLGVMIPGTPYAEEGRLRQRHAVLSGLRISRFAPEDPEHISFMSIFHSQEQCQQAKSQISLSTILPYEWLVKKNPKEYVLLLWINDDAFQEQPLAKLGTLISQLYPKEEQPPAELGTLTKFKNNHLKFKVIGPAGSTTLVEILISQLQPKVEQPPAERGTLIKFQNNHLKFKVIGPAGSTTLVEMIKELQEAAELRKRRATKPELNIYSQLKEHNEPLKIYSAMATAEEEDLLGVKEDPEGISNCQEKSKDAIAKKFCDWGITFQRTICFDEKLVQELIDELKSRRVVKGDLLRGDHIALISEWDTLYGRSLPKTFADKWKANYKGTQKIVHHFSYLRGIDGKLPGEQDRTTKERQKNGGNSKDEEDLQDLEKPMGSSQYDYLRRLAERIYELDQQLGKGSQGSIKAIGVLGSDFYDKYLVLQALRQRLPDRIFFTTNLDASLLHPANIKYTRNLVVASGFGLQLHPDLQGDVPPFRDVYQTSVFLATLLAFSPSDQLLKQTDPPPNPRLFEIGNHHAIDLTDETGKPTDPVNDPKTVQPPRQMPELHANTTIYITLIILLSLLFLWLSSNHVKNLLKGMGQLVTKNPAILVLALVLLMVFYKFILQNPSEGPFSWTEGVSVWPTNILRLIAILLSWCFIFGSIGNLKKSDQELREEFRLGSGSDKSVTQPSSLSLCEEIRCDGEPIDSQSRVRVNPAWEEYVRRGRWGFWLKGVILLVIIYGLVCILVLQIWGWPTIPTRGFWSFRITIFILVVTILSFLFLTFFVFYTTHLCRRFLIGLLNKEPHWNRESLDQFRERVGLRERELSEWMLIQLIAKRTEVVGKLIYYPVIVLVVIVLSRLHYFYNWHTPPGLIIVIFMSALLVWTCAFMLRRAAEKLRADAVERLALVPRGAEPPSKEYAGRIKDLQKEINSLQRGAFAPYLQNPVVHSLLALGGLGGTQLLGLLGYPN